MKIVDTNIIIRFLVNDDDDVHAEILPKLINESKVIILNEVLIECVFVLNKVYKIDRQAVAQGLSDLISNENIISNQKLLLQTLSFYENSSLDIVDCLLASHKKLENYEIFTLDKKLDNWLKRIKN